MKDICLFQNTILYSVSYREDIFLFSIFVLTLIEVINLCIIIVLLSNKKVTLKGINMSQIWTSSRGNSGL